MEYGNRISGRLGFTMKPSALIVLLIVFLTSACVRPVSTAPPMTGRNPFTPQPATRLCAAADLETSSNAHDNTEALILGVTLINHSKSPCSLLGPPLVTLLNADQPLDVQLIQAESGAAILTIAPGEGVILIVTWRNYCGSALKDGPGIHLTLSESESLNIKPEVHAVPRCETANAPSTLTINPYSYPP